MQHDINRQHSAIGKQIQLAKKRMFKEHREGKRFMLAADGFWSHVSDAISEVVFFAEGGKPETMGRQAGSGTQFSDYVKSDIPAIPPDEADYETEQADEKVKEWQNELRERQERIEGWARAGVDSWEKERSIALIRLLNAIEKDGDPSMAAFVAKMAIFKASDILIEEWAIPALLSYDELPGGAQ